MLRNGFLKLSMLVSEDQRVRERDILYKVQYTNDPMNRSPPPPPRVRRKRKRRGRIAYRFPAFPPVSRTTYVYFARPLERSMRLVFGGLRGMIQNRSEGGRQCGPIRSQRMCRKDINQVFNPPTNKSKQAQHIQRKEKAKKSLYLKN